MVGVLGYLLCSKTVIPVVLNGMNGRNETSPVAYDTPSRFTMTWMTEDLHQLVAVNVASDCLSKINGKRGLQSSSFLLFFSFAHLKFVPNHCIFRDIVFQHWLSHRLLKNKLKETRVIYFLSGVDNPIDYLTDSK